MSATEPEFNPEDYEGLNPKVTQIHPAELRKLRKEAEKARELEAKLAEAERRETFALAGIPLDDPAARYFVKAYDGEMTPEAIKAAAVQARVIQGTQASAEEIAGHQAAAAAAAGAEPVGVGPNLQAQLAEMAKKQFGPADDTARQAHMAEIARLARENNLRIPVT